MVRLGGSPARDTRVPGKGIRQRRREFGVTAAQDQRRRLGSQNIRNAGGPLGTALSGSWGGSL